MEPVSGNVIYHETARKLLNTIDEDNIEEIFYYSMAAQMLQPDNDNLINSMPHELNQIFKRLENNCEIFDVLVPSIISI